MNDENRNRFELKYVEGSFMSLRHVIDRETGVNYLMIDRGGLTPLFNADGSLYITKDREKSSKEF